MKTLKEKFTEINVDALINTIDNFKKNALTDYIEAPGALCAKGMLPFFGKPWYIRSAKIFHATLHYFCNMLEKNRNDDDLTMTAKVGAIVTLRAYFQYLATTYRGQNLLNNLKTDLEGTLSLELKNTMGKLVDPEEKLGKGMELFEKFVDQTLKIFSQQSSGSNCFSSSSPLYEQLQEKIESAFSGKEDKHDEKTPLVNKGIGVTIDPIKVHINPDLIEIKKEEKKSWCSIM